MKSILVDKSSTILILPSQTEKIWNSVYNLGFLLNNCRGIVVPNKIFKIFKKPFNNRLHYLEMRKRMVEMKNVTKKIQVLASVNFETSELKIKEKTTALSQPQKSYFFYDASYLQNIIEYFRPKLPERKLLELIIDELQQSYKKLKENSPLKDVRIVFDIKTKDDFFYNFLVDIRRYSALFRKTLDSAKFFDGYALVSAGEYIFPILEYDEDGKFLPIIPMVSRLEELITGDEEAAQINGSQAISNNEISPEDENKVIPNESIISKIVDTLNDPSKLFNDKKNFIPKGQVMPEKTPPAIKPLTLDAKSENGEISIELDSKTLNKIMKYYKVTNPDIIANTKAAIDNYIKETGNLPSKTNAEMLVMKAVAKSIHGTDDISDEYLANPNLLFDKLKSINVFSMPLDFPKDNKSFPFEFKDIVTLKSVTGQHRQHYEFAEAIHENIEKVFKTLEEQPLHPIKVNNISYEYVDTDSDRYTEYTINLENIDGNKQKYQVKLHVPAPISDKYFKIGGNRYIFSSQQHLKVLTKTVSNETRLLTNYAICRLSIENLKYSISDINDIASYIQQRYPQLIISANDKEIEFEDGDKIYLVGNNVYDNLHQQIVISEETGKFIDLKNPDREFKHGRFELLFDIILGKIQAINPEDNLTKTKKSIPYIALYMSGIKLPFIIYMWSQKGLLSTLNQFGISYVITEDRGERGSIAIELANEKFLIINPTSIRERLLVNGLLVNKLKYPIADLDSPEEIRQHITDVYGKLVP